MMPDFCKTPTLRNFIVTDRQPCWVTWTYIVQATDEADAVERYCQGEYEVSSKLKIGENISMLDNEIEAQDAGEITEP